MIFKILLALLLLLGPLGGCAYRPDAPISRPEIWTTYARNVPHATRQRVDIFVPSDEAVIAVTGFPQQWVTISIHDAATGRLLTQTTQYVQAHAARIVPLKRIPAGRYIIRASQDGVLKAESSFMVH